MKRPRIVLLLCLLAGLLAWWQLHDASDAGSAPIAAPQASDSRATAAQADPVSADPASTPSQPAVMSVAAASDDKTGPRHKRAYMLSLDQGALALVQAQDIEGDFATKRGSEEVWSTMLRCRLMSETNAVLAEELLPAPDKVCHVLDPRAADAKPVNFTNPGPVIFQVRMPRVKDARRLDIYRILQPGEPSIENLIGSLPLPPS